MGFSRFFLSLSISCERSHSHPHIAFLLKYFSIDRSINTSVFLSMLFLALSHSLGTSKLVIFRPIDYESIIILSRQDDGDEDDVGTVRGNIRFEHTVRATFKEQNIDVCIDGKLEREREREHWKKSLIIVNVRVRRRKEKSEQLKSVHMMGILVLPMHVQSVRLPVGDDDVGEWNRGRE